MKKTAVALMVLFVGLSVQSLAFADSPQYRLVCGVSQGTQDANGGHFAPISGAQSSAPIPVSTGQGSTPEGVVTVNFKTAEGEAVVLQGYATVLNMSMPAFPAQNNTTLVIQVKFPQSNKTITQIGGLEGVDPKTSGNIRETGLDLSVGSAASDYFRAGCKIQKLM